MYILAIETTGKHASVALTDENGKVQELISDGVLNHLQNLTPMISKLIDRCKIKLENIDIIAASEGPGSFTGIRIGVSTARALAQMLGTKTIGVPTLKSFVYNAPDFEGIICPIFDARREEIYAGAYRRVRINGEHQIDVVQEPIPAGAYNIDDFLNQLSNALSEDNREAMSVGIPTEIMFFGDGIEKYGTNIDKWGLTESVKRAGIEVKYAPEAIRLQSASSVARLALDMYKEGVAVDFEALKPNYMRKAEAERKLEAGSLKITQSEK